MKNRTRGYIIEGEGPVAQQESKSAYMLSGKSYLSNVARVEKARLRSRTSSRKNSRAGQVKKTLKNVLVSWSTSYSSHVPLERRAVEKENAGEGMEDAVVKPTGGLAPIGK